MAARKKGRTRECVWGMARGFKVRDRAHWRMNIHNDHMWSLHSRILRQ